MQLTLKQEEVIRNKSQRKVLNWGRRSGKTTVFAYEALGTALTVPDSKITYFAQTFGDARDIAWEIFLEVFGAAIIKKNESLLEITVRNIKGGTSKISLKGWESVVTGGKGRGTENDLILADEVAFCRGFLNYWTTVLEPTLLTTKGRAVFASTPNGFNDFYDLANRARQNEHWYYSHATSYDNPANDKQFLEDKKKEIPEDQFAQEYLADFRKQEGLVYKEFDRQLHTYNDEQEKNIDFVQKLAGVDFGFVHPAAVIQVIKDKRGSYWAKEKLYATNRTDAQIAQFVTACDFNKVFPDPENQGAIKELKDRRVNCCDVIKGKNSVVSGISKVRELLKQGRLKIHKDSVNLIWEFETYHYKRDNFRISEDESPEKENDHALDALRYVIMMDAHTSEIRQFNDWIFSTSKPRLNPAR